MVRSINGFHDGAVQFQGDAGWGVQRRDPDWTLMTELGSTPVYVNRKTGHTMGVSQFRRHMFPRSVRND
jgi:hypothetical protein